MGSSAASGTCRNTAIGINSLWNISTGINNLAIGREAGYNLSTGSNCFFFSLKIDKTLKNQFNFYLVIY